VGKEIQKKERLLYFSEDCGC